MSKRMMVVTLAIGAVALSACTRFPNNIGYIADEELVSSIQPGIDNKDSVLRTLGRPSIESEFDGRQWYYVSRNTDQFAFLTPKPTSQQILRVDFDAAGNVAAVNRSGLETIASIDPVGDETPTLGRETGILSDLFGNVGAVGAAPGPPQGGPNSPN